MSVCGRTPKHVGNESWPCCFTSTEARLIIRDGDRGGGGGGDRGREWSLDRGYRLKKTGETVDRRQNNGSVKAVSPRYCAATSATAVEEQPEAKEVQLSQPSSTSMLMISYRLTWRSSSTSLLISPGTLSVAVCWNEPFSCVLKRAFLLCVETSLSPSLPFMMLRSAEATYGLTF